MQKPETTYGQRRYTPPRFEWKNITKDQNDPINLAALTAKMARQMTSYWDKLVLLQNSFVGDSSLVVIGFDIHSGFIPVARVGNLDVCFYSDGVLRFRWSENFKPLDSWGEAVELCPARRAPKNGRINEYTCALDEAVEAALVLAYEMSKALTDEMWVGELGYYLNEFGTRLPWPGDESAGWKDRAYTWTPRGMEMHKKHK